MSAKKSSSGLSYFSEDSAGFRIQPKTVLIMSLVYIGIVVLLHIYSKLGSSAVKQEEPKAPNTETNNNQKT
jgi:protein transport protein SEC61 subunit beta